MQPTASDTLLFVIPGCVFVFVQFLGLMFFLEVGHKAKDSPEKKEGHRFSVICFIVSDVIGALFLCLYLERNPFLWMVLATIVGIAELRLLPSGIRMMSRLLKQDGEQS